MSTDPWRPAQYDRFKDERARPFRDLLALVTARPAMTVVDLGYGTAELTRDAHRRLAARRTVGVDRSAAMLEKGGALAEPGLELVHGDLAEFARDSRERFDLVLSNAALHWVPDHPRLFADLVRMLEPGGQLAIQLPVNHEQPPHLAAAAVAAEEPFVSALGGARERRPILPLEDYASLLHGLGLGSPGVRVELYTHLLADRAAVVEWVKGSTLTWYEERLPAALFPGFVERYRARLYAELPDVKPFVFTFRRLFLWGRLGA
jgi:trans-aconitate 2-methyltransferase